MSETAQRYRIFDSAMGFCGIAWSRAGVTGFRLPVVSAEAAGRLMLRRVPDAEPGEPPAPIAEVIAAARRYFEGEKTEFSQYEVDLGEQEAFFYEAYNFVRKLAFGQTTTYGAIAKTLGAAPAAARDVGQAMARNPVPLIIPCHRVLAAGGKIGGFSAPGGSTTKARMLALEGVAVAPPPPMQRAFGF